MTRYVASDPAAEAPLRVWELVAFSAALAIAGLVALAVTFAGTGVYHDISIREDIAREGFRAPGWPDPAWGGGIEITRYPHGTLVDLHRRTLAYVLSDAPALPPSPTRGDFYSPAEQSHLADVRGVFLGARIAALGAVAILAWLLARRGDRRAALRLARAGAVASAAAVLILAGAAALAFDAMFLLFHQVFFPQGNFLFDARSSNMLTLYPEAYFYGVSLRIGASFVALAGVTAAVSHVAVRRRSASA